MDLITQSKNEKGESFTLAENSIYTQGNNFHNTSRWGGSSDCDNDVNNLSINSSNCSNFETGSCFGQKIEGDRYLWVYKKAKRASCAALVTEENMWGRPSKGVDLRAWTNSIAI